MNIAACVVYLLGAFLTFGWFYEDGQEINAPMAGLVWPLVWGGKASIAAVRYAKHGHVGLNICDLDIRDLPSGYIFHYENRNRILQPTPYSNESNGIPN